MTNEFYFVLKALFVFGIFTFYITYYFIIIQIFTYLHFNFLVMQKNGLTRKLSLIVTGQKVTKIQILPNISRSKGNQAMKFGHLIDYNKRKKFREKSCTRQGGKVSPRPFQKKSILSISLDPHPKISCSLFYCMSKSMTSENC